MKDIAYNKAYHVLLKINELIYSHDRFFVSKKGI
jgi:hypothetical protein